MINGIGVVGWGVGGIEGEAAMLGQPVYFLTPDVVGLELTGTLREGCTATDLVLTVTELLRKHKVVGKFVEFFGEGTRSLAVPDRATIGNMAPEYGATMGFFPVDERTIAYFEGTGRSKDEIRMLEAYFKAQGLFGVPMPGEVDYSTVVRLDLGITPSLSGPKRPQDRIEIGKVASTFKAPCSQADRGERLQPGARAAADAAPGAASRQRAGQREPASGQSALATGRAPLRGGDGGQQADALVRPRHVGARGGSGRHHHRQRRRADRRHHQLHQHLQPGRAAGGGPARQEGGGEGPARPAAHQDSLSPGSRIVTEYLRDAKLLPYLEQLGFTLAGYGCMTCIGNSGDLTPEINEAISQSDLVCAAVLSGNRNFEARIHPNLKANFLASPPLVVAYALAGTVLKDLMTEPVGQGADGQDVWLGDIWPSSDEVHKLMKYAMNAQAFRANYGKVKTEPGAVAGDRGRHGRHLQLADQHYIAEPPFFDGFTLEPPAPAPGASTGTGHAVAICDARIIGLFGDSITTDHISPAGSIKDSSPAGRYLQEHGVQKPDFNSYARGAATTR